MRISRQAAAIASGAATAAGCGAAAPNTVPVVVMSTPASTAPGGEPAGIAAAPVKTGCQVVGKLSSTRHNATVVALPDGRALFVGGGVHDMGESRAEVDAYDPKKDGVAPFARLVHARIHPGAAVLADGRVVVVGGITDEDEPESSIEIYEPATRAFREVPATLDAERLSPFAIPMKDGRVLMGGGTVLPAGNERDAYVFDPSTQKLAPVANAPWPIDRRAFYTVAPSGAITVPGAAPSWVGPARDCEAIFDPASGTWTETTRCQEPLSGRYPAADGSPGTAAERGGGLDAYRNGAWETVLRAPYKTTGAALWDGITLDAHHAVASDAHTHEVVRCTF
jgi:hypothetical protein